MLPLVSRYQQQVQQGLLRFDQGQLLALEKLTLRLDALCKNSALPGLYLHGPVGRGKTLLMDWFYESIPSSRKNRLHFHHFMAAVHKALFQLQGEANPLKVLAKDWANRYQVLCFDEFFVSDIADAMLLGHLWQALFEAGVMLVATSNSAPKELYRHGHRREHFLPFIALLEQHCEVFSLDAGVDYRREGQGKTPYYWQLPLTEPDQVLLEMAHPLTGELSAPFDIQLNQRDVPCLGLNQHCIAFDFFTLCGKGRSQLDYMQLASHYRMIVLSHVPAFRLEPQEQVVQGIEENYQRPHPLPKQSALQPSRLDDEARRFIALVDECYDRRCLLLLGAEVEMTELYQATQLEFAFARTVSRLIEMQRW